MTSQTILAQLQKAVPHFHLDPEWFEDNLTYPAINDFARYICSEAAVCSVAGIPRDDLHRAVTFWTRHFAPAMLGSAISFSSALKPCVGVTRFGL